MKSSSISNNCAFDEMVAVGDLRPHPQNPNTHPDEQVHLLAQALTEHGWRLPVTVSTLSGYIVRGHGRLLAAQFLRLAQVPVDYQDYPDHEHELSDLLADNILSELSVMDMSGVDAVMAEIDDEQLTTLFELACSPQILQSDDLNQSPGQRMNRNNGTTEVVAIGRWIGATDKELTEQVSAKLEEFDDSSEAARFVCELVLGLR